MATYRSLLRSDPDLTQPVAAISALIALLAAHPAVTTVSETLALLSSAIATLKRSTPQPIALSAGTDLFQRYLAAALNRSPGSGDGSRGSIGATEAESDSGAGASAEAGRDFAAARAHLLANGRLFAARARDARRAIAGTAHRLVGPGTTVLTAGGSRVVTAVLRAAAAAQARTAGAPGFRVVHVVDDKGGLAPAVEEVKGGGDSGLEGKALVGGMRELGVPVASVPPEAVALVVESADLVMLGAEAVTATGGVVSRLGTCQIATLARAAGKLVYVVAESHKFVRTFPMAQADLGVDQGLLRFSPGVDGPGGKKGSGSSETPAAGGAAEAIDYTPPHLITALVTEHGIMTPSAVSEELIKIWY